jgi:cytochrome P450
LFSAGTETSSVVVLWVMSEMAKNPNVMEEAQAEVRRVFDMKGYVDETELH